MGAAVGDAFIVLALSSVVGLGWNVAQEHGIPLIPDEPPAILVPCPEATGDAGPLAAAAVAWGDRHDLVIDSRSQADYDAWHAPGALHIVYDFLEPVPDESLRDLVASGSARVVVYGDGGPADTGEQLAKEISGRGVRNVVWIEGGAEAVRATVGEGAP